MDTGTTFVPFPSMFLRFRNLTGMAPREWNSVLAPSPHNGNTFPSKVGPITPFLERKTRTKGLTPHVIWLEFHRHRQKKEKKRKRNGINLSRPVLAEQGGNLPGVHGQVQLVNSNLRSTGGVLVLLGKA